MIVVDLDHMVLSSPADAAGAREAASSAYGGRIEAAKEDVA